MNLSDFIHAPTRPTWTVRLLAYIALILTVTLAVQVIQVLLW